MRTEGGIAYIPGLVREVSIDVAALAANDRSRLDGLMVRAQAAHRHRMASARPGKSADHQVYVVTFDDGYGSPEVLVINEFEADRDELELVEFIRTRSDPLPDPGRHDP